MDFLLQDGWNSYRSLKKNNPESPIYDKKKTYSLR